MNYECENQNETYNLNLKHKIPKLKTEIRKLKIEIWHQKSKFQTRKLGTEIEIRNSNHGFSRILRFILKLNKFQTPAPLLLSSANAYAEEPRAVYTVIIVCVQVH